MPVHSPMAESLATFEHSLALEHFYRRSTFFVGLPADHYRE